MEQRAISLKQQIDSCVTELHVCLYSINCQLYVNTPWAKKHATLLLTTTLVLVDFCTFYTIINENEYAIITLVYLLTIVGSAPTAAEFMCLNLDFVVIFADIQTKLLFDHNANVFVKNYGLL